MKKFVITESERSNIRKMYNLLNEGDYNDSITKIESLMNQFKTEIMKYNGKTVKLYSKPNISTSDDEQLKKQNYEGSIKINVNNTQHYLSNHYTDKFQSLTEMVDIFKTNNKDMALKYIKKDFCSSNIGSNATYGLQTKVRSSVDLGEDDNGNKISLSFSQYGIGFQNDNQLDDKNRNYGKLYNENFTNILKSINNIMLPVVEIICSIESTKILPDTDYK